MRTANPALNDKTFRRFENDPAYAVGESTTMTLEGTVVRTGLLMCILVITAAATWTRTMDAGSYGGVAPWMIGGAIGGLILGLIISFKPTTAPMLSPLYAAAEGLFLGALSAMAHLRYPGIAWQAITLTMGVALSLLIAYSTRMIRPSENFKLGIAAATGGIFMVYGLSFVLSFFGIQMPYLHSSGPIGIGISVVIVIIAALNLVLDFDFIENGVEKGAPKYMEWVAAFGLMVTLIWLYIEILHLLMKLRER
ncbi:MAG: putative YccA/Bax inhibitor family protein [Planctomycetota bacterium]